MKVLITGAQGQVGQEVVLAFKKAGHEAIGYAAQALDITNIIQIEEILKQYQDAKYIINCAAYTLVDKAEAEPDKAYQVNALGIKNLAQIAQKYQIPVIHISTDYIFDGEKSSAYVEDDLANPESVYGQTKWQGEEFLRAILDMHIILRVSWVFGRFGHNFVKTMLRLFNERSELGVVDDQQGCPTPAQDIAAVILTLCEYNQQHQPHWGTYHYCGTPETSWFNFASKIYELAKLSKTCLIKRITTQDYPTPAKRPKNSVLSTQKIKQDFGITAKSWESGLQLVLEELRSTA